MASRLAHLFIEEIVAHCTHGIDLHTAAVGRTNLPQIRADLTHHPELQSMAQAFSTPVILNTSIREGSLRHAASEKSVQTLLYEAGEALRFEEIPIRAGVRGILSVMRQLEMLPSKKRPKHFTPLLSHRSRWVRSPQSGILRAIKSMGKFVNQGDILGYVADPFGDTEITVHSHTSGIIIGRSTLPLVHEGEALFHVADVDEHTADSTLHSFHHEIDPRY